MVTAAQVQTSRLNARQSTGPRTPEGKAIVAHKALVHGSMYKQTQLEESFKFEV